MVRRVIIDSWAFIEQAGYGRRSEEVANVLSEADALYTVRDVVAETFTFIANRKTSRSAADWLEALQAAPVVVLEPTLEAAAGALRGKDLDGRISFADYSVAWAADHVGTRIIASADRGFRRLGLDPLFAPPG